MSEKFYKLNQTLAARKDLTVSAKFIYAVIIDHIGANSTCWPGIGTLAKKTGLSRNTIIAAIRQLERHKLLQVSRIKTGTANHYSIQKNQPVSDPNQSKNCTSAKTGLVQKLDPTSPKIAPEPVQKLDCNQTDLSNQTQRASVSTEIAFVKFWKLYPKHIAKEAARKSWLKLKLTQVLCEEIMSAVRSQKETEQWQKDDGRFIPHPATWLNQRRWEDELPEPMDAFEKAGLSRPLDEDEARELLRSCEL